MLRNETYLQEMLAQLRTKLLVMCATCEIALDNGFVALKTGDGPRASAVIEQDSVIDDLETDIDAMALSVLVRAQPVAQDLRFVVATLRIVIDVERIGDEAANISERTLIMHGHELEPTVIAEIYDFMDKATATYQQAIETFKDLDSARAIVMCAREDEIVQQEVKLIQTIMDTYSTAGESPTAAMHAILIARSLSRICRRAINIAGHTYFIAEGKSMKHVPLVKEELEKEFPELDEEIGFD